MHEIDSVTWKQLSNEWLQKVTITQLGKLKYEYHYKVKSGKPCVVLEIKNHITKQISGYTLIEKDLRDSLLFLEEIQNFSNKDNSNEKGILLKALTRAIGITYGKCFTEAGGRKVKLDASIVSEKNSQSHKDMMETRHKYVAHAGESEHESCKCILLLPPSKNFFKGKILFPGHFTELYQTITPIFLIIQCKPLIEEVHSKVKDKLKRLWKKIDLENILPKKFYETAITKGGNRIILNEEDLENMKR